MSNAKGLDISHWQVAVDWDDWKDKGYDFTYIKVSEGTTWTDFRWKTHYDSAVEFERGPYHYFRAQWDGAQQGRNFWNQAKQRNFSMPPAVDVEKTNNLGYSKSTFKNRLRACLLETEEQFGVKPIIYTSQSMWEFLVGSAWWADDYDLWTAHYTTASSPLVPSDWRDKGWKLWQWTSRPLDQNKFNGTMEDFLSWIGSSPDPEPPLGEEVTILEPGLYRVH